MEELSPIEEKEEFIPETFDKEEFKQGMEKLIKQIEEKIALERIWKVVQADVEKEKQKKALEKIDEAVEIIKEEAEEFSEEEIKGGINKLIEKLADTHFLSPRTKASILLFLMGFGIFVPKKAWGEEEKAKAEIVSISPEQEKQAEEQKRWEQYNKIFSQAGWKENVYLQVDWKELSSELKYDKNLEKDRSFREQVIFAKFPEIRDKQIRLSKPESGRPHWASMDDMIYSEWLDKKGNLKALSWFYGLNNFESVEVVWLADQS